MRRVLSDLTLLICNIMVIQCYFGWRNVPVVQGARSVKALLKFIKNDDGAVVIEYALIASVISIFVIGFAQTAGQQLVGVFTDIAAALSP